MVKKNLKRIWTYIIEPDYRIKCRIYLLLMLRRTRRLSLLRHLLSTSLINRRYIRLGKESEIGMGVRFPHPHNIVIGDKVAIGRDCIIYQDVTLGQNKGQYPHLGNSVIVYTGARIIGGVIIGDNAVIGANAVVTHDVPANAIVGGIPAKVIRYRSEEDVFY